MEIRYSDLEDEIRDGFYVNSLMKCCWMAQLKVLEHIDRICQKYNIQYQAEWGSLLGTVRHGGFIPWDDDMDISMKRQDYNKFLKVAAEELPEGYHIMSYRNDEDYWDVMARVVNSTHINLEKDFLEENCYFPFSTGIDIFPMDFLPTSEGEAEVLRNLVDEVKNTADAYGFGVLEGEALEEQLKRLEILCNMKIDREGDLREHLYDIVVSLYALYHEEESKEIALMPLWLEGGAQAYPKEYYAKTARLPFDKINIPVPIAYDSILKQKYGDYMKMVRKGGSHDYPYYKAQIRIMNDLGVSFLDFKYEDRICRTNKTELNKNVNLDKENLLVLENAHLGLCKLLLIQEKETAMQLLINCQECALTMGEAIEKTVADSDQLIVSLEEYCELVFQLYQLLQSGENPDPEAVYRLLQEQLAVVKEQYTKEYPKKKKIVFVVDKASRWKSVESIWKAAKEDKNNIVSVVVVPYCYRMYDGSVLEECYEKDMFPQYVDIVDYQTFDLEKYHPDTIFINTPYDQYNYMTNIHPYYYSSNLINMCEQLIYVPWFIITELTKEDERGWQSMQHFVTMPGVVNADKVIVQSEQMKEAYVQYLTDWAGEETRGVWEEKISGLGFPLMDVEDSSEELEGLIPEEWKKYWYKEDGSCKKAILYNINASSFIDYKEKAINKLKNVLKIFKDSKEDICLLWSWNTIMQATVETSYPELWQEYQQVVGQFKEEDWGIYVEDGDPELMVSLCNAYYGDGCKISQAMVMAEKPVMLQNFDC
ncbi:MAG: LicD family protein [Lachnospiraceae bacterium]|nr:LicD family protein [Lachnospiraceae bacterium]